MTHLMRGDIESTQGRMRQKKRTVGKLKNEKERLQHLHSEGVLFVSMFGGRLSEFVRSFLTQHGLGSDPDLGLLHLWPHLKHAYIPLLPDCLSVFTSSTEANIQNIHSSCVVSCKSVKNVHMKSFLLLKLPLEYFFKQSRCYVSSCQVTLHNLDENGHIFFQCFPHLFMWISALQPQTCCIYTLLMSSWSLIPFLEKCDVNFYIFLYQHVFLFFLIYAEYCWVLLQPRG